MAQVERSANRIYGAGGLRVVAAFMGLLALYLNATDQFGATYGPLAGTIGVLLWSFLTSAALLLDLSFAAQLEAVRAGRPTPRADREENL